ncbi:MAG: DUF3341 domain-containing protein, partial [Acidobacteria bacterium]|nr:DUF3341 domain-containing protein [Acidobacteriota bacterium]
MADEKDKPRSGERYNRNDTDISASPRHPISASPRRPVSPSLYGVMAEFDNPSHLVAAARRTYEAGYRRINGYSPYPIEELWEAIGFHRTGLPIIVLIGG